MSFPEVGREIPDDRFAILISSAEHAESCDPPLFFGSRFVQKHFEAVTGRAALQDHLLGWSGRKLVDQTLIHFEVDDLLVCSSRSDYAFFERIQHGNIIAVDDPALVDHLLDPARVSNIFQRILGKDYQIRRFSRFYRSQFFFLSQIFGRFAGRRDDDIHRLHAGFDQKFHFPVQIPSVEHTVGSAGRIGPDQNVDGEIVKHFDGLPAAFEAHP